MNLDAGAGIGAHQYEITHLATGASGEPFLILIGVGTHLHHEQHWGEQLLEVHGLAGFNQPAVVVFICIGEDAQQMVRGGVRYLTGLFFSSAREHGYRTFGVQRLPNQEFTHCQLPLVYARGRIFLVVRS